VSEWARGSNPSSASSTPTRAGATASSFVAELGDLHGRSGIDVLCVTDHVVRRNDPWREIDDALVRSVEGSGWAAYLSEIEREAKRAWGMYGMRLLPGLELTFNDVEPVKAARAVALGLRTFIS
jgi:hypothetical protein